MTENRIKTDETDANANEKDTVPRTPRSIRFSDSEWTAVEQAAKDRGMTAAVLVRHAAMGLAEGRLATDCATPAPGIAAQIERIYRGVYLLSTLKRDEMLREGQKEELDRVMKDARNSQAVLLGDASN